MMEINDFLNEDIVGALCLSGVRLFHALIQNGKKVFENRCVCDTFSLSKIGCRRLY